MKAEKNFDSPFLWHNLGKDHLHLLVMLFPTSTDLAMCLRLSTFLNYFPNQVLIKLQESSLKRVFLHIVAVVATYWGMLDHTMFLQMFDPLWEMFLSLIYHSHTPVVSRLCGEVSSFS